MDEGRKGILGIYAFVISMGYFVVFLTWVFLTNMYLDYLLRKSQILLISKGVLFALVSAVLLFLVIRYYELSMKRSNEALQLEEKKFRELYENANDATFLYELGSDNLPLKYMEVNRRACEQLGYTRDELLLMSPLDIIDEQKQKLFPTFVKNLLEKGSITFETAHVAKDGSVIPCELSSRVFEWGEKKVALSSVRYIADRKRMEDILRESEAKYRLIADNMSDLISVLAVNGVILYASPSHLKVLGFASEEYEGVSTFHFVHSDEVFEVKRKFFTVVQTGETTNAEFRYLHASGHWVVVESHMSPVIDESGNVDKVIVVSRDITGRKQAEEQLLRSEKLTVVGELAAGVAHEIRNPLTSLKGFLQLLAQNEENARYCSIMLPELERINEIVSQFLMIAKPQVQNLKPTSIQKMLNEIIELLDTHAVLNNILIMYDYDLGLPLVTSDEGQLKQVMINILKNAIDAMPKGGKIVVEVQMHDENKVLIRVIDNGCGIPKGLISKIGEPFYTTKEKGTGLGLMMSKRIIEAHNGKILIMSEEGVGTIVDIVLPIQQS